ncbi:MAG: hypothetical protein GF384_03625 [Elusimicrobia bacterium]|nr:hypothetical protein [Elusimicrobiota bacterium]
MKTSESPLADVAIGRDEEHDIMIISDHSEKKLCKRLFSEALVAIVMAMVFYSLSLILLLANAEVTY